jgi:tetrathionate reductase subunit A
MKEENKSNISRRSFLGKSALFGGTALTGVLLGKKAAAKAQGEIMKSHRPDKPYELNNPENIIYSVCLNCNTGCGMKAKLQDGILTKIDGNPYNPWTLVPHIPYSSNIEDAAKIDGGLCPKGQAGVQIAYDPYRIRKVLKRAGKRGENKWISIDFKQAINEIIDGGKLFSNVPGEENRHVEGLREIMALTDPKVAKDMASDIKTYFEEKDKEKKKDLLNAFKEKHSANLDKLIDPEHPDLGPKNNQFVISWGRLKNGRKDFFSRLGSGFGTTNLHGHTTVCQGSLYFTCKAISDQYAGGKFSGGKKFYWQTDIENAKYILFVGANLFEANYGPTNRSVRLTNNLENGFTKIAVVDPRFSKLASKADVWLPIKPGEDSALALAIIQWIIQNKRYDEKFLKSANKAAANKSNETCWTNASWLVEVKDNTPIKLVRATDLGLRTSEKRKLKDAEYEEKFMTVMVDGKLQWIDPNDDKNEVYGDLFIDKIVKTKEGKEINVKSGLQLLKESAEEKSFDEWCEIAGVSSNDVEKIARELTSYGKLASVDMHRGPAQHTNGFYNILSWMSVNMLIGNFDWAGGLSAPTTFAYDGTKGGLYDLKLMNGKIQTFGISSIRHEIDYEKTSLFKGYPAKRNWYPLSSDVYEEIIPSIGDEYPYPVKALFMYMGTPVYALPAGQTNIDTLIDVNKLPLFFCSDILIGTTSMYADYIFPDLSFLERWEFQGTHPNMTYKVENIRQPVIAPIPEIVEVYGEKMPISLEALFMAIGEKLELKTFGKDAFGDGQHLYRPEDLYIRAVANLAFTEYEVPDADDKEIQIFLKSREHLPKTVFDAGKWEHIAGAKAWKKVIYLLNRGGRYENIAYKDDKLANQFKALLNLYQEKTASKIHAGTGKKYHGIAKYIPQSAFNGDTLDSIFKESGLHLITHRTVSQTKARTISAYWLHPIMPENGIIINPSDAKKYNLANGDIVKVVSSTNPDGLWDLKNGTKKEMLGKVILTETIRPGVISFALGFGHWATGSSDIIINDELIKGDPSRGKGVHANAAMWTDPSLRNNTCLIDPLGGSVSFYDSKVKLIKV